MTGWVLAMFQLRSLEGVHAHITLSPSRQMSSQVLQLHDHLLSLVWVEGQVSCTVIEECPISDLMQFV